ncbi:MAG: hypothetical protein WCY21_05900 [Candidatus Cloacimonadaceae bacterium]|jgi:5-methylcytosine-specific restriction enzyme subunit McrC|nr:McrC family protein [Candidatus Cloacimonadota bacterium]MDX9949224.1 hypothetical protein [Candidatus Syntrophosphaera sp.]
MAKNKLKQCFEHQSLKLNDGLSETELKAFQSFYGSGKDFPYYSLIHNGIKFNEYVGVIQVGKTVIEVLPKADKESNPDKTKWQSILIGMLRVVNDLKEDASGYSSLKLKPNSILEMYFEIFITEVEYLIRTGMLRKYRNNESNQHTLKGRLVFSKQIQKNLVHKERFYTRNTIYDHEHIWHIIIHQAIKLIKKLSENASLHSRIGQLELIFPSMPSIHISENTFTRLVYNRQTIRYQKAIEIAKLLLLNYHPDIQSGRNNVLALMFNMNELWERFVYKSLGKHLRASNEYSLHAQKSYPFWKSTRMKNIKPDIIVKSTESDASWIWDTKWKLPKDLNPSSGDLQQMYAYAGILDSQSVALVYPGEGETISGKFVHLNSHKEGAQCSIISIPVSADMAQWQKMIYDCFERFLLKTEPF